MAQEIERKFLVKGDFKSDSFKQTRIMQGYLCTDPARTVRVRIKGDTAYLTIKGHASASGASRYEWEKEITVAEAHELLMICEAGVIDKMRYLVRSGRHLFEVDEFYGENEGLVVAEIELETEDEAFEKPEWLGTEVTGDARYFNSMLMKRPYNTW